MYSVECDFANGVFPGLSVEKDNNLWSDGVIDWVRFNFFQMMPGVEGVCDGFRILGSRLTLGQSRTNYLSAIYTAVAGSRPKRL